MRCRFVEMSVKSGCSSIYSKIFSFGRGEWIFSCLIMMIDGENDERHGLLDIVVLIYLSHHVPTRLVQVQSI